MRVLIFTSWLQNRKTDLQKASEVDQIADKNKDGWLVVQEYESDDLASDCEDEKKIRRANAAAEKKRKEAKSKFKSSSDLQLFRGKATRTIT